MGNFKLPKLHSIKIFSILFLILFFNIHTNVFALSSTETSTNSPKNLVSSTLNFFQKVKTAGVSSFDKYIQIKERVGNSIITISSSTRNSLVAQVNNAEASFGEDIGSGFNAFKEIIKTKIKKFLGLFEPKSKIPVETATPTKVSIIKKTENTNLPPLVSDPEEPTTPPVVDSISTKILTPSRIIERIIERPTTTIINQTDPTILSRLQNIEQSISNNTSFNSRQVDRIYSSVNNNISGSSNNITESGTLNNPTFTGTTTASGNTINLSGSNPIIDSTNASGTLSINTTTDRPIVFGDGTVTFGSGVVTIPNLNASVVGTITKADNLTGGNSTTLLGSVPYQSNVDTTTLLTPNTTTTKKFFSMTGTGTNGAAPFWETVTSTDVGLGNVTNESKATMFTTPTFTTSITTPLVLGGTGTTQDLSFQTTSGVGATGADMHFLVGNNGATEAMTILNDGKVGIGTTAPSQALDVTGKIAIGGTTIAYLPTSMTGTMIIGNGGTNLSHVAGNDGYWNTFVGIDAGITNTTGQANTAVGNNALYGNTTGNYNGAFGIGALTANTTGIENNAFGYYALGANTTGNNNSAFGDAALFGSIVGSRNSAFGDGALQKLTSGSNNSSLGYSSLYNLGYQVTAGSFIIGKVYTILTVGTTDFTLVGAANNNVGTSFTATGAGTGTGTASHTSSYNVGLGDNAGRYLADGTSRNTTGDQSIYIGYNSRASSLGSVNEMVIGTSVTGGGSNTATWGNTSILNHYFSGNINATKMIGGSSTTSDLTLQTTSGVGASGADMHFLVGNNGATEAMTILNNGYVGLGNTNPLYKLEVAGTIRATDGDIRVSRSGGYSTIFNTAFSDTDWHGAYMSFTRSRGTSSSQTAIQASDTIGVFDYYGYDGTSDQNAVKVVARAEGTISAGVVPGRYQIYTANSSGASTLRLSLYSNDNVVMATNGGEVGIGVASPTASLHLKAGTATASTAPLKFTSGALLTTPEAGAVEFLTDAYYGTITTGAARKTFAFLESPVFTTPNIGVATGTSLDLTAGNLDIDNTTFANQKGIITKNGTRFIHDFNYGNNGTVTTSGLNTFIGGDAGNYTMGSTATAVYEASYNVGLGASTLSNNTTGYYNMAIGTLALGANTTGLHNVAVGASSLTANTTGFYNVGIGSTALGTQTTGTYNVAIGRDAGRYITGGATSNLTGDYNIFLGSSTKALADNDQNEIVIGYNTTGNGSNTATWGNTSILNHYFSGNINATKMIGGSSTTSDLTLQTTSGVGASGADMHFLVGNNGATEAMTILNDGSIGIGDISPSQLLEISSSADAQLRLTRTGSNGYNYINFYNATTRQGYFGMDNSGANFMFAPISGTVGVYNAGLSLYGSGGNVTTASVGNIIAPGSMGLGTTSPTYKLDVKGTTAAHGIRSDMGFDIYQVPTPTAPTGVVSAGGSVDTGNHRYLVTYTTAIGETNSSYTGTITTTAGNNTVTLTIPVSTDPRVTGRKIYRTKAGENIWQDYYLATIANNTDVSYIDTAADSTLTGSEGASYTRINTTSNNISLNGVKALNIDANLTSLGYLSAQSITTAGGNAFYGAESGRYTTTGISNSAFGSISLRANTTGYANTAIGNNVLASTTTAAYNTGVGYWALTGTTGSYNTGLGGHALSTLTTGIYNTAIGFQAGRYIADGATSNLTSDYSLYIGTSTKAGADNNQNEIVIGYNAIGNGSNTTTIGTGNVLYVGGSSVAGIAARFTNSTGYCDINPTTTSLVCSSDINLKKNITTLENIEFALQTVPDMSDKSVLERINYLTPVNYNWQSEEDGDSKHIGFIAQEMEQLFPDLVGTDEKTGLKSISYSNLTPYLVKAIQEMNLKILDINNMEKENNWRDSIISWFANSTNGIENLFVKIIHSDKSSTKQLCVSDDNGEETCLTKNQLDQLLLNNNINNTPAPEPEIVSEPEIILTPENTTSSTDSASSASQSTIVAEEPVNVVPEEEVVPEESPVVEEVPAVIPEAIDTSSVESTPIPVTSE